MKSVRLNDPGCIPAVVADLDFDSEPSTTEKHHGPGNPPGRTLLDIILIDRMESVVRLGVKASLLDLVVGRSEFHYWKDDERQKFVRYWSEKQTFDIKEASLFVTSLREAVNYNREPYHRLVLTGASAMYATQLLNGTTSKTLHTIRNWDRSVEEGIFKLPTKGPYLEFLRHMRRLTGMSRMKIVNRMILHRRMAWDAEKRLTKFRKKGTWPVKPNKLDVLDKRYRKQILDLIHEDRKLRRLPASMLHPHEAVIAMSEWTPVRPCSCTSLLIPHVHCIAPGCNKPLDAMFFKVPAGKNAPLPKVCSEHRDHFWAMIENHYPGGIRGYAKGEDAQGFRLASCWMRESPAPVLLKPERGRKVCIHDVVEDVTSPDLVVKERGIWEEIHAKYQGFAEGSRYFVRWGRIDVPIEIPEAARMADAVTVTPTPETVPMMMFGLPIQRWERR